MDHVGFLIDEKGTRVEVPIGDVVELDPVKGLKITRREESSTQRRERKRALEKHAQDRIAAANELNEIQREAGLLVLDGTESKSLQEDMERLAERSKTAKSRAADLSTKDCIGYEFVNTTRRTSAYFPPFLLTPSPLFAQPIMFVPHQEPCAIEYDESVDQTTVSAIAWAKPRMLCLRRTCCHRTAPGFQDVADAVQQLSPLVVTLVYCRNETVLAACGCELFHWIRAESKWATIGVFSAPVTELACSDNFTIYVATEDALRVYSKNEWVLLIGCEDAQMAVFENQLFVLFTAPSNDMEYLFTIEGIDICKRKKLSDCHGGRLVATSRAVFRVNQEGDHYAIDINMYAGTPTKVGNSRLPLFLLGSYMVLDDKPVFFSSEFPDVTQPVNPLAQRYAAMFDPESGIWTPVALLQQLK
jgi:hypothetical protein